MGVTTHPSCFSPFFRLFIGLLLRVARSRYFEELLMREIFYPNSVAVIGVSSSLDNLGRSIVLDLLDREEE
jgi:hypothetical protein